MIESYSGCMEDEADTRIDDVLFGWGALVDERIQAHRSRLRRRVQELRRCIQCELVGRDVLLSRFDCGLKSFQCACLFTNRQKDVSPLRPKRIDQGTALTHSLAAGIPAVFAARRLGTLPRRSLRRPQPVYVSAGNACRTTRVDHVRYDFRTNQLRLGEELAH